MIRNLFIFMITLFSLAACTGFNTVDSGSKREANNHRDDVKSIAQGKNVKVFENSYLGATIVHKDTNNYPVEFKKKVDIRATGTLTDLVERIRPEAKVNFRVEQENEQEAGMAGATAITEEVEDEDEDTETTRSVHYSGDIEGYLHMLANKFGAEWSFDDKNRLVEFDLNTTKTFTIYAMPGDISYDSLITNSASASSTDSEASTDSESESAQSNESKYTGNFWEALTDSVKTMLTDTGKAHCNQNIGTVTVTDTPKVVRRVEQYIDQLNKKLGRQIAYEVRVLALQTNDIGEVGFDLNAVFESGDLSIVTTPAEAFRTIEGAGSMTAKLLSGKGTDSTAVVSALKSWGDVSQLTSASGFAMHNTPTPVQVGGETGYVSSSSSTLDGEGNTTTSITTSKQPEGFFMTVVPHILKENNVLLQYNISLTNIDAIETFEATDLTKVQLPEVSSRSFSQKVRMQVGQTLVLGGFEQTIETDSKGYGVLSGGSSKEARKRIIVIIISIDSAGE